MHPSDAARRGIRAGDCVRVFNDRGALGAKAELGPDVLPGLVVADVGHGASPKRSGPR